MKGFKWWWLIGFPFLLLVLPFIATARMLDWLFEKYEKHL